MVVISFLYPIYLWFLLLVPFFVFIYFFGLAYNKKKAFIFSNFQALERFYGIEFFSKNFMVLYLNVLILILVVLSLAGTVVSFNATTSSYSYVLLIDNSGSMSTVDIEPSRLVAAKNAAKDFVDSLPFGVSVGVVGFSGEAVVYQELTTDKLKIKMGIDNIDFGEVEGTNIYNAVISADRIFDKVDRGKLRSIIVISDGQVNVGEAPQIISFAQRNDIVINTIGVGSEEGGVNKYNIISKVDIDFLSALAFNSGGNFFRIEDAKDMGESFNLLIDRINDNIEMDVSLYILIGAICLFTINWILFNLRFKIFP